LAQFFKKKAVEREETEQSKSLLDIEYQIFKTMALI